MRILALQTDPECIKKQCLSEGEEVVLMTYYHALSFFFASLREIFFTMIFLGIGIGLWAIGAPMVWVVGMLTAIWFFFIFFNLLKAWIDWRFDFILVTTDKLILVDQTSLIRQKVNPIHLENIGSIASETQYWNLFGFGKIIINLKEGEGGGVSILTFVPNAEEVASKISATVTYYQRYVDGNGPSRPSVTPHQASAAGPQAASGSEPSAPPHPPQSS
jgi:hypothetical protein